MLVKSQYGFGICKEAKGNKHKSNQIMNASQYLKSYKHERNDASHTMSCKLIGISIMTSYLNIKFSLKLNMLGANNNLWRTKTTQLPVCIVTAF